jgi:uncharacterized membrane protein (DUF4010 family)
MPELADPLAFEAFVRLAVSAAVGFLIGFEREWMHAKKKREQNFAGARTFTLIGFAGGLAGLLGGAALIVIAFAAIAALTIAAYGAGAQATGRRGGTTEIAIFTTFLLGVAAAEGPLLIAAVGAVFVAIVLNAKQSLVRIAQALTEVEIRAALQLLALSVLILPILPNEGFGPYGALNPREIWIMVVFISGLSFLGYWLNKILGARHGAFVTGIVGGLASSTATTLSLARLAREGAAKTRVVAAGVIAANVVMLIRVSVLLAAVSRTVLIAAWPVLAAGAAVGAAASFFLWRSAKEAPTGQGALILGNPLEIRPALIFAALLAVIAVASRYGADRFGEAGLMVIGFISGLADVDALTLMAGRQASSGVLDSGAAAGAVAAAVVSNIAVKAGMAAGIGGRSLGAIVGAGFAAMIAAGAGVYLLF